MLGIYTSYNCKRCKNQLVLITEEIENMVKDKYLACPYCGCKHIEKQKITDSLKECMSEHTYRRNKRGAMEQRR